MLLAADGATGLTTAARHHPDLLIVDLGLPDMDGTTAISGIRGLVPGTDHCAVRRHAVQRIRRDSRRQRARTILPDDAFAPPETEPATEPASERPVEPASGQG